MQDMQRMDQLYEIAEQDDIYQFWKSGFEGCIQPFHTYAAAQPEDIRSFLLGYADFGRMMMQRMVILACRHMEFISNPKSTN